MAQRNRTAPESWGFWPPSQERINVVVERAARSLLPQVERLNLSAPVILLAKPRSPKDIDNSFPPGVTQVCVGYILALTHHRRWMVYWQPDTDTGTVSSAMIEWGV